MIAIITVAIINIFKPVDSLKGTFIYSKDVKYEFNGKGNGTMYDNKTIYKYTYVVKENVLKIDFKDKNVKDATYTFIIKDNILTLIGGEGTMGGEYILERESE